MQITLYRKRTNALYTEGELEVNFDRQTYTVESTDCMLPAGRYILRIVKKSERKQSLVIFHPDGKSTGWRIGIAHSYIGSRKDRTIAIGTPLIPGTVLSIPEAGLTVEANVTESSYSAHSPATIIRLDYESISGGIVCSSRRPGDVIRPAGRGCTKKLKSLLLEAGLTQNERNTVPVFRDDKGIIAVPGIAVAERCRCVPGKTVLEIIISKKRNNHG